MQSEGRLLSRVMLLGVGAAISKATVFFLMPLYTAVLTPDAFGGAEIVVNVALLLIPVVSLGLPDAVFRFIAGGKSEKATLLAAARIGFAGVLGLAALLPLLAPLRGVRPYLSYLFFYVLASSLHAFFAHILRARGDHALYTAQQLFCTFLTVALSFLFLPVLMLGVRGYLLAILLSDMISAAFIALYLFLRGGFAGGDTDGVGVTQLLSYSAPLIPTAALWWSIAYVDRFVLLSRYGAGAVGLLAAAGRLPSLLTFGAGVFFEAWQYSALRAAEGERAALFERIYGMLCAGLVALSAALMLLARPLVRYLFAADFHDAAHFVPLLVLGALFSALSSFLGSAYMVKMRSRMSLLTALFGALINLFLCLWLVPRAGTLGAASATAFSYLAIFVCRSLQVRRILPFAQHGWRLGIAATLLFLLAFLIGNGARRLGLLVALLALLPFLRESIAAFRLVLRYLQDFFKKKQKYLDL